MNGDASLGGDGIISNALVENNIIYDNGTGGGSAVNCDGVQNSVIQNNLLYNNHASGIALFRIDGGGGASNNVVANNTILQASDARWALLISDGSTGNIVFNNIIYSDHLFRGSISVDAASIPGFHSDYNVQTDRMSIDGGNTVITLAEWQEATQSDSNSFISNPQSLFEDPTNDNYHLGYFFYSPAIDAGAAGYYSFAAPDSDIENNFRPNYGFFDIGCYEFYYKDGIENISSSTLRWDDLAAADEIWFYDLSGRLVFTGRKEAFEKIQRSLPEGIYFFKAIHQLKFGSGEIVLINEK